MGSLFFQENNNLFRIIAFFNVLFIVDRNQKYREKRYYSRL